MAYPSAGVFRISLVYLPACIKSRDRTSAGTLRELFAELQRYGLNLKDVLYELVYSQECVLRLKTSMALQIINKRKSKQFKVAALFP